MHLLAEVCSKYFYDNKGQILFSSGGSFLNSGICDIKCFIHNYVYVRISFLVGGDICTFISKKKI